MIRTALTALAFCLAGATHAMAADSLLITASTASPAGGSWGAKYVAVIWIQDAAGTFIKTVGRWGNQTGANDLPIWNSKNGGVKTIDGVTAATLTTSGNLSTNWKLTNAGGTVVANGTYTYNIEINNHHTTAPNPTDWYTRTAIVIDGASKTKNGADSAFNSAPTYITNIVGNYFAAGTGIENQPEFQISSNPFGFTIGSKNSSPVTLRLFAVNGKLLWRQSYQMPAGGTISLQKENLQAVMPASGFGYLMADNGVQRICRPVSLVK